MSLDTEARALLTQADRLARLQESLASSFARELATVLKQLERQIRVWALQHDATGNIAAARAATLRAELRDLLQAAGFRTLIDDASAAATERVLATLESGRDVTRVSRFATRDLARVEALRSAFLEAVVPQDEEMLIPLWRTVVQAIYAGRGRKDLIADLVDAMDRTEGEIATLYDTAVSVFTRQVQAIHAPEGSDALFLYAGPADVRLRPFCRERVGKVYSRREIDGWDNGQLPNPFVTLGGYNCRHALMAVPNDSSLAALHGSDQRVPAVTGDLKFAEAAKASNRRRAA